MTKKFSTWLLACLCVSSLAFGSACGGSNMNGVESSSSIEEDSSSGGDSSSIGGGSTDDITQKTVKFGSYPQTKVTSESVISALNEQAGALPTESNSQNWTSYKYYIENNNETDYMWYQDVVYGENSYRGVYFTSYRPSGTTYASGTEINGYTVNNVYWFAYETLNWTVLEEKDGEMLLLCNSIIDSQEYYDNYTNRTINGATVYANNYAESNIRKWLNETFYETAFTSEQQSLINVTEVVNSAKSTNPYEQPTEWDGGVNKYACENTNDKIFLLSEEEVTNPNYGFASYLTEDTARLRKPSDYALCQGLYQYDDMSSSYHGNGWWGLRSPSGGNNGNVIGVHFNGTANVGKRVVNTDGGVVPALKLRLE